MRSSVGRSGSHRVLGLNLVSRAFCRTRRCSGRGPRQPSLGRRLSLLATRVTIKRPAGAAPAADRQVVGQPTASCDDSWRDLVEITITTVEPSSDGLLRVSFAARSGSGKGIWRGPESRPGDVYQVELTLLDELEPGRNVYASLEQRYSLSTMADTIAMNVFVESADPDGVASLRLGSDCLFLAEVVRGRLQPGQWVRACLHIARIELWPYDAGSFTVIER